MQLLKVPTRWQCGYAALTQPHITAHDSVHLRDRGGLGTDALQSRKAPASFSQVTDLMLREAVNYPMMDRLQSRIIPRRGEGEKPIFRCELNLKLNLLLLPLFFPDGWIGEQLIRISNRRTARFRVNASPVIFGWF